MQYTFPFNTCETTNNKSIIAQPYSVFANLINSLVIIYFLLQTQTTHAFLLLASLLCFELVHTFSHSVHLRGSLQTNLIHTLSYIANLAFFYAFYSSTKKWPTSHIFWFFLVAAIAFDIYAILNLTFDYYLLSQSLIFIILLAYYYPFLPKSIQNSIYQILFFIVIILALFVNEKYNCQKMLAYYPHFPYHILIEIAGFGLFYTLCSQFYAL